MTILAPRPADAGEQWRPRPAPLELPSGTTEHLSRSTQGGGGPVVLVLVGGEVAGWFIAGALGVAVAMGVYVALVIVISLVSVVLDHAKRDDATSTSLAYRGTK